MNINIRIILFNAIVYLVTVVIVGINLEALLICALASCLIWLAIEDYKTYTIPNKINIVVLLLGVIAVVVDNANWRSHLLGAVSISGILLIVYVISRAHVIGGGDIKLMAAAGLMLGLNKIVIAFLIGGFLGVLVNLVITKCMGMKRVFAFGPYLAIGIYMAALIVK